MATAECSSALAAPTPVSASPRLPPSSGAAGAAAGGAPGPAAAASRPPRFVCKSSEVVAAEAAARERLARLGLSSVARDAANGASARGGGGGGGGASGGGGAAAGGSAPAASGDLYTWQPGAPPSAVPMGAHHSTRSSVPPSTSHHPRPGRHVRSAAAAPPPADRHEQQRRAHEAAIDAARAAALSDAAVERVRAAFPPSTFERRMFHELANVSEVPETPLERRQRVAEAYGHGAPLRANRSEGCCICLDALRKGDVALTLTCGHMFHEHCIHEWLGRRECCPLCRH